MRTPPPPDTLAARLQDLRREKRYSLRALAAAAGCADQTVRLIEAGGDPKLSTVVRLAGVLMVPPGWLAWGEGAK